MKSRIQLGIDKLLADPGKYLGHDRVGLITNHAAADGNLTSTIDRLFSVIGTQLTTIFGPEHGVRGASQAGEAVTDGIDELTGIPVFSLYGPIKAPTVQMLQQVEVLVLDLPDVGCRYWTYLSTLSHVLQSAAQFSIPIVVLDRPNPITGSFPEGNLVQPEYRSFVGVHEIPMRTGLTIGECALLFNDAFGLHADLTVVPLQGWERIMWQDETQQPWISPSPNMTSLTTATLYPGTCLIEGTNLSEGRGTTRPFEVIGAPWVDGFDLAAHLNALHLPGVGFRPTWFTPTFSKHQGKQCQGVQVHILKRNRLQPVRVGLHILAALRRQYPDEFSWLPPAGESEHHFIDMLAGTDSLRRDLAAQRAPDDIWSEWNHQLEQFLPIRQQYLLY